MSSSATTTSTNSNNAAAAVPALSPIDTLNTPASTFYTNLHPILLLSVLTFSFRSLVADPVNTLFALAPTVAMLQAAYCILCLPSSGDPRATKKKSKGGAGGSGGGAKGSSQHPPDLAAKVVPAILSFLLTIFLTFPLLYILIILHGAPLTPPTQPHTLLLALHLALLTTPPLFYVHGLASHIWLRLVSWQFPIDEISGAAWGALVGGWIGAVPIPLDWDREWQRWPVTVLVGVYAGTALGKFLGGLKGVKGRVGRMT